MSTMETMLSHIEGRTYHNTIDFSYSEMKRAVKTLEALVETSVQFVNFDNGAMRDRVQDAVGQVLEFSSASFWPAWKFLYKTEIVYSLSRLDVIRLLGELRHRLETRNKASVSFTIERIRRLPVIR
ncbi:hypothetical protein TOTORO_00410 [Serratia phage vB_SmaS-Totoro]|nr:hypothetical protein TOTORO_00410 [Serratia phage vB_SmaS-Totoro]